VVKDTAVQWDEDQASRLAASLALYTMLSIAPLLILSIAIAGMAFGEEAARGQISQELGTIVGPQAGAAIQALVANARAPEAGVVSSIVGIAVLLFGASGVFGELQTALNQIWNVKPRPGRGVRGFLRDRFFSFTMVMGVAFLLLVSLVVSAALALLTERFTVLVPLPALWQVLNLLVGLGVTTVLFALIFKIVPDAKIAWRDVWVGAFVTAVLFTLGKGLLGWYVGRSATVSPFGAAGSLVALVVWVYYSAQILFLGAEFAQVYATRFGSAIVPTDNAVPAGAPEPASKGAEQAADDTARS
jgi:membrane protein